MEYSKKFGTQLVAGATSLLLASSSGCYVWGYSHAEAPNAAPAVSRQDTLHYRVHVVPQLSVGSAREGLVETIRANGIFARTVQVEEAPEQGTFVEVRTRAIDMSTASLIWGYVSISTLHILPAYSGSGGFDVRFHIFSDKKEVRVYEYPIRRRVFAWLPTLPFIWLNALTQTEHGAMQETARRFFADATRENAFDAPAAGTNVPVEVRTPIEL